MRHPALQSQLSRCVSCGRGADPSTVRGTRCEVCGGVLRSIWGLGQLAASRRESRGSADQAARRGNRPGLGRSGDSIVAGNRLSSP
jgi:hypothetical protein